MLDRDLDATQQVLVGTVLGVREKQAFWARNQRGKESVANRDRPVASGVGLRLPTVVPSAAVAAAITELVPDYDFLRGEIEVSVGQVCDFLVAAAGLTEQLNKEFVVATRAAFHRGHFSSGLWRHLGEEWTRGDRQSCSGAPRPSFAGHKLAGHERI